MEAACLINDLKPAIKVSLFARDTLGVHVLNANFAAERASLPARDGGRRRGSCQRRINSLQPCSLACTQAAPLAWQAWLFMGLC